MFVMIAILFHIPAEAAWMRFAVEDSQSEEGEKAGIKITDGGTTTFNLLEDVMKRGFRKVPI